MITNTFFGKKILQWCGALLLVLSFVVISYSPSIMPSRIDTAEAAWSDAPAIAQRLVLAAKDWVIAKAQEALTWILANKEMVLDGLAWLLINVILEKMSQDIIKWINSGFKGRPAFVQNPEQYFLDIADKVIGDKIWGSDFKFLCSPFALDIKLALELQYANSRGPDYKYTSQCTLSKVINNVDGFFAGDFLSSGWEGWVEVTTKPQNNPIGALALGSMHLNAQVGSKQKEKSEEMAWGRGLLSTQKCVEVDDEDEIGGTRTECSTVTPGAAIQDQLSRTLSIPVERLTVADEFNEIINALFNQLVKKAFEGAGGLLGMTENNIAGAPGTGTYFTDLANSPDNQNYANDLSSIVEAVEYEQRYLAILVGRLNMVLAVVNYKFDMYGADLCHPGTLSPALLAIKADLEAKILDVQMTIAQLNGMIADYTALGNDQVQERLAIIQAFMNLKASNSLHTEVDIAILESENTQYIEEAIIAYKQEVDAACFVWNPNLP